MRTSANVMPAAKAVPNWAFTFVSPRRWGALAGPLREAGPVLALLQGMSGRQKILRPALDNSCPTVLCRSPGLKESSRHLACSVCCGKLAAGTALMRHSCKTHWVFLTNVASVLVVWMSFSCTFKTWGHSRKGRSLKGTSAWTVHQVSACRVVQAEKSAFKGYLKHVVWCILSCSILSMMWHWLWGLELVLAQKSCRASRVWKFWVLLKAPSLNCRA